MNSEQSGKEAGASADKSGIQVIARAAAVLRALKDHPQGLSLGELAKLLGLARSTVQRIVEALDRENLVIAASPTRGVRLGPALLALAAATRFEVAEIARPILQEISLECGETVDLSILDGDKLVFVEQIVGVHRLRAESAIGVSFPLHSTAPGKAMLALMTDEERANLKPKLKLTRITRHTVSSWPVLMAELDKARETGLSHDLEENSMGISAVATALRVSTGEMIAISIPVPTQRFDGMRKQLEKTLMLNSARLHGLL
ncbi:IclR family transcriptional regulator [Aquabacterium sp.]|uniref:IclR family transcriptional regulator n=1 Tax=Aquabacterium sp. TaxID=1872578 RepID=UPI0025BBEF80|nr:IclR family transcriptional regulator [Aquabacterium sp.]